MPAAHLAPAPATPPPARRTWLQAVGRPDRQVPPIAGRAA